MTAFEIAINQLYNVGMIASKAANVALFLGDPNETCSSRAGKSIRAGGWAARVRWPAWLRTHFLLSINDAVGQDGAATRRKRI